MWCLRGLRSSCKHPRVCKPWFPNRGSRLPAELKRGWKELKKGKNRGKNRGKIEVKMGCGNLLALRTKLEPPFGNHRLQTLGTFTKLVASRFSKTAQNTHTQCIKCVFKKRGQENGVKRRLGSGSFFHPQPPSLPILLLELGSEKSPSKETRFSLLRSESPGNCNGNSFCPDQVLSKTFHPRPFCRRKILSKELWGWGVGVKVRFS